MEEKLGVVFKNKDLLKESLTHRSYLNENPSWGLNNNERLEFLGDAVLELAVTEMLFEKYPNYSEGDLTSIRSALVNYQMLSDVAKEIELNDYILLSRGEAKDTGKARDVILANAFEAVLGAIYLDAGYETMKKFVDLYVMKRLKEVMEKGLYKDPKSLLQEIVQEKMKLTPNYQVLSEEGPDHAKIFTVGVFFDGKLIAKGEGSSKQEAEVDAAKEALRLLN
ncbi:MAG: Ribonuclease 3 [Candidatus Wolfebacteria bacterium GW2011_GWC1_37_10]|uniref:Ribonuclease 3 n=1 Tax=Candidatus Wolfebacteria bacterium GW2011_GWC1_37_10 TaxID=1619010 RepID=A0A0G0IEP2_9BACT|nr:MAG: Ribonuclease 3 [Candidatus Wolfebacteria bacterium GW2011_GWC1_37_10]